MLIIFYFLKFICLVSTLLITFSNQNPIYAVLNLVLFFVTGSILLLLLGVDFLPYVFIIVYAGAVAVLFLFVVIILKIKLGSTKTNYVNTIIIILLSIFLSSLNYSFTFLDKTRYLGYKFDHSEAFLKFCDSTTKASLPLLPGIKVCDDLKDGVLTKTIQFCVRVFFSHVKYEIETFTFPDRIILCLEQFVGTFRFRYPYPAQFDEVRYITEENFYVYDKQSSLTSLGKILYTEYNIHFVLVGLVLLVAIIGAITITSRKKNTSLKQKIYKQTDRLDIIGKTTIL